MVNYRESWHPYAKTYIDKVEETFKKMGCFEDVDKFNLDLLGDSLTLYLKAKEELDRNGLVVTDNKGRMVANPCVGLIKNQQGVIISFMKELSLSLRQRRFLLNSEMVKEDDPISKLFEDME